MTNKKNKTQIEGFERRSFKNEIRVDNDDSRKVVGYASVFNSLSENLGGYREVIQRDAFNDVLKDDVRALLNHDPSLVLARSTNGEGTLSLSLDDTGLRYSFDVPEGLSYGDDLLVNLKNGNITQSSFGFVVEDDSWGQDENGNTIRTIKKVARLLDVSPVTYPAYPDSTVSQSRFLEYRTKLEKIENEKQQKDLIKRNLYERKLKLIKIKNKNN